MTTFYRAAQQAEKCDRCPIPLEVGDPIIEEYERTYDGDELAGRYHEECDPERFYGSATGAYLGSDPAIARADARAAAAIARWDAAKTPATGDEVHPFAGHVAGARRNICHASCGCGWEGPGRTTVDRADADHLEHQARRAVQAEMAAAAAASGLVEFYRPA